MTPTVTVEIAAFNAQLREYVRRTQHTLAYAINKKMLFILRRARELTPVANRPQIQQVFNVTQTERIGKKTGKLRRTTDYTGLNSSAYALLFWKRKQKGLSPFQLPAAEREAAAKKLVAGRLRAIGSLKSGWNAALMGFSRAARFPAKTEGPRVKQRGSARIAQEGWNPEAVATYSVTEQKDTGEKLIDPRVETAVAQAFREETASMKEYLDREGEGVG